MKKVYFLLLMFCISIAARAQTAASYTFTRSTGTYTSIAGGSGTTTVSGWTSLDDGYVGSIPIGFTFTFCGVGRTTLSACTNGWLSLANFAGATYPGSASNISSQGWLFALWHDGHGSPGAAYYQTSGSAPNRVFTFEWQNWGSCCTTPRGINVQIKLFENGNVIQMCYGGFSSSPGLSIGIGNSSSDYQYLPSATSTTCSSSGWGNTNLPNNGEILQWALQCGTIVPGAVSATVTNDCSGFASTVNLIGASGEPGISYQWQSSPDSITWTNVSGATTTTYSTTVPSTIFFRNRLGCSFTSTNANSPGRKLTNNTPPAIGGASAVCVNAITPFTNTTLGGDWFSTNSFVATVGTAGAVQGVAPGTATISYTSLGCSVSKTVVVNPLPAAFTVGGGGSYCAGGAGVNVTLSNSATGFDYQLFNGSTPIGSPLLGSTGSSRTFGPLPLAGTYTVTARNTTTSCLRGMTGSATVVINPVPGITNGPSFICEGLTGLFLNPVPGGAWSSSNTAIATVNATTGVVTGMSGGIATITYTLPEGCFVTRDVTINPAVPAIGGVANVCAGLSTTLTNATAGGIWTSSTPAVAAIGSLTGFVSGMMAGASTMTYTLPTGCLNTVSFTVNPLPASITGTTNFCIGSTTTLSSATSGGTWSSSNTAIATAGLTTGAIAGVTAGAANIIYTLPTGCIREALVNVTPLPQVYNVTGGGGYCVGTSPNHIFLSFSNPGISYQLYNGTTPTGIPQSGTGASLDFGEQPAVGVYTIVGTNTTSLCSNNMAGSVIVSINPLPVAQTVSGTGNYCEGGTGRNVSIDNSVTGTSYQLYNGFTTVGAPIAGTTGSRVDFGLQTIPASYTVWATNTTTGCRNIMTGSAVIGINYLPTSYAITGGGSYCAGDNGVPVILNGSDNAISYQLYLDGTATGTAMIGVTGPVDFGLKTATGSYNVIATNTATGCSKTMDGSVAVSINPVPATVVVTGGGNFCAGGLGVNVGTGFSNTGINYMLYKDMVNLGIVLPGTGAPLDFGLQTTPGTYTIKAENAITRCISDMTGSAVIGTSPLPTSYSVTGGGSYCSGGTGVRVGLRASNPGIAYQLYNGTLPVGASIAGSGAPIDFGIQTTPGSYTVMATNTLSLCASNMTGVASVNINPVPNVYSVSGGGAYCAGGSGRIVGLTNSEGGLSYQLWRDGVATGLPLTGIDTALDFGLKTLAGTYTVRATNTATGCSSDMSGTATVSINSLPTAFTVTGGGSYCATGSGLSVGLSGSTTGVEYQLWNTSGPVATPVTGTGGSLDFGLQTAGGIYTVTALNTATLCSNNMAGSTSIIVNAVPAPHAVIGGGAYCAGGRGSVVGIDGSDIGIDYQLYNGTTPVGLVWHGTGTSITMGAYAVPGTYTVMASNIVTECASGMTGSASISINPILTPAVSISSTGGLNSCASATKILNASVVNGGTDPMFVWNVNGLDITGSDTADYAYVPTNGDRVKVTMTTNAVCPSTTTVMAEVSLAVLPNGTPTITISANTADTVCQGTPVTFTAASTFGGSAPSYTWFKNGVNIGTGSWVSTVPTTGDRIVCGMISNYTCRTTDSVGSNQKVMANVVVPTPVVTITASPVVVGLGLNDTLTASVVNGGTTPSFQWVVNGSMIPSATSNRYISNHFNNRDSVACMVMSSHACGGVGGSGSIIVRVRNVGVDDVTKNNDVVVMPNPSNGSFVVKGNFGTISSQDVTLEVTNMLGQVVYSTKVNVQNGAINEKVQLYGNVAAGMYMLNLRSETEQAVFHIMVQQ